jgi:hypothetical protein
MIGFQFDLADIERRAQTIGASIDQVPFAISTASNAAARSLETG